jgi:sugar phosphate isomerase/epimerase
MLVAVTRSTREAAVLLGTVAIEPNRWTRDVEASSILAVSEWFAVFAEAGFDGVELWERHVTSASSQEQQAIIDHALSVSVFNSYVSLDDPDPAARAGVADWAARCGSTGIKFNVGKDLDAGFYADRIAEWVDLLAGNCRLLCECHHGISIAEDPATAAKIFEAAGPRERVQAIVHTHEDPDDIRARFDAYGDRITHVHVNFLDFTNGLAPRLSDVVDEFATKVELLTQLGFDGSWTLEFVEGVRTDNDEAGYLVAQAIDDLAVLRSVLA